MAFARKVEGLYARYQARTNQLAAERRSVRRLLDMLIEREIEMAESMFGSAVRREISQALKAVRN